MDRTKLEASIKLHEGLRLTPYQDTTGQLTIGWGHNLTDGIRTAAAQVILDEDVDVAIALTSSLLPWTAALDDVRQRAFVEMVYNLGSRLLGFTRAMIAAQAGEWPACVAELQDSLWARQVGHRAVVLEYMLLTGSDNTT